jgi:hypothetical protein
LPFLPLPISSKFLRPGFVRIGNRLKHGFHFFDFGLALTAALDAEQKHLIVVLQNRNSHNDYRVRMAKPDGGELAEGEGQWLEFVAQRNSLKTILFQL